MPRSEPRGLIQGQPPGIRASSAAAARAAGASLVAVASTVVFFGAARARRRQLARLAEVARRSSTATIFRESFPDILEEFATNVQIFLIAEALILVLGARCSRCCAACPGRCSSRCGRSRSPTSTSSAACRRSSSSTSSASACPRSTSRACRAIPFFWGVVALVLVYSAYVAEVYRAGIESVHPSQEAAARSLGLTRPQSLRYVVVPQAVRRVVPPLLNDFIGLQKDTALVALIGLVEAFRPGADRGRRQLQLHAVPRDRARCSSC